LRDELATVYKTQGQNAQRLLSMNETLREKEELARVESENLRKARDEVAVLRRKVEQHAELMAEKDRTAQVAANFLFALCHIHLSTLQILHDEINTLQLELGQIEERNQTLGRDNAKLLQRWLDAKQAEANKMNEANEFYENMRSQRETVLNWRGETTGSADGTKSADSVSQRSSGNGDLNEDHLPNQTKSETPSPRATGVDLTPNG
jgi:autophagy-related protein 16-1